jgi:hypothetical protein
MVELGHVDLADPEEFDGPDEAVAEDLAWGPGLDPGSPVTGRPIHEPFEPVGVSAAAELKEFFARQRTARAAQEASAARRGALTPPAPEVPAMALTRALLAERGATSAAQLWDAAVAAGWTVSAAYARGPMPTAKTLCPACLTWQIVTKVGAIKVHGPLAARCQTTAPDPDSPDYQIVDSVIVRALSPRGHRLAATWIDDGDDPDKAQYAAAGAKLWHVGDRPRDADVVAVRSSLKAIGAARKPKRAPRARRAA